MPEKPDPAPSLSARQLLADAVRRLDPSSLTPTKTNGIQAALQQARQNVPQRPGSLDDISVEFVRSPDRGVNFDARHNAMLLTRESVEALLSGDQERINELRAKVETRGGFFLRYQGEGKERLEHAYSHDRPGEGGWLMAETSGRPMLDPTREEFSKKVLGGDGQFLILPDRDNVSSDELPLPDILRGDTVMEGEAILQEIMNDPACAMLIADIATLEEYRRYGFARATEDAAFMRVLLDINHHRQKTVKYALAAMASLKGVQDANHQNLSPIHEPGMRNMPSLLLHVSKPGRAPGFILGKQKGRTVPVELPAGDQGHLLFDWYVTAQPLANVKPRSDIDMHEEQL